MKDKGKHVEKILAALNFEAACKFFLHKAAISECENWIENERNLMRKRIQFLLDSEMNELQCNHWILKYSKKVKEKKVIEIFFCPVKTEYSFTEMKSSLSVETKSNPECDALHFLLYKSIKRENYELCSIIKKRLDEIKVEVPSLQTISFKGFLN